MSLRPEMIGSIPPETARVTQAAFPHGNRYVRLRDELGVSYDDALFAPLFSSRGRPAEAPWRLALVSVLQFAEELSDRQAADAVCARIDRKYVLGLELTDPGFDASVLRVCQPGMGSVSLSILLANSHCPHGNRNSFNREPTRHLVGGRIGRGSVNRSGGSES